MTKSKQALTNLLESYSEGKQAEIIDDYVKPCGYWNKENHLYIIYSLSRKYFGSMDDLRNLIEEDLNLSKNDQLENLLEDYAFA